MTIERSLQIDRVGVCTSGLGVGLAALLVCLAGGCRGTQRETLAQHMVDSRQLAVRGQEAIHTGRWDEATKLFGKAVEACPANERAHAGFADTLWQRGQTQAAIVEMREAVRLSAGDGDLQVRLGQMQLAVGDVDGAESCARLALQAQGQNAAAWALDGDVQRARGRLDDALRSYHRALACEARMPRAELAIADIYAAQDRPLRALATLDGMLDRHPVDQAPPELLARRGLALRRLGRTGDAIETLTAAWRQPAAGPEVAQYLAECQMAAGQLTSAQLTIQDALRRNPQSSALHALAAQLNSADLRMAARQERQ